MIFSSVSSSLMLTFLLLALSYNIHSAPTHHLTIGVQGNTPTLIVTSSEIGITPETMGSPKKLIKPEHSAKFFRDLDTQKKSFKTKLNKNQSLFNKRDKLLYLPKPLNKQMSSEETLFKITKSADKHEKTEKTFKQHTDAVLLMDQKITTKMLEDFKTTTTAATPTTTADNDEIYKTNLKLTTLPPEQINDILLTTSNKLSVTTEQPEEVSAVKPQATTVTSSLADSKHHQANDLKIPLVLSTTLNTEDFDDITSTMNYIETISTTTVSTTLAEMQKATKGNDVATETTEETIQILQDTTVIKTANENDNDRYTQDPVVTTENENLLLTTIETKETTTSATTTEISTPTLVTLITDNAEATTTSEMLSLPKTMTTTTTANVVDDYNSNDSNKNEQQQFPTEYSETATYRLTTESDKEEKDKGAINPAKAETQVNNNGVDIIKPKQEYTTVITAMQSTFDDFKSTENPVQDISAATAQELMLNVTANKYELNRNEPETIAETKDLVTTNSTPLTSVEQHVLTTVKTNQINYETTENATNNAHETFTTEEVLKLIDLEKPVLKIIDELKQPSLLMTGQHNNGHDGLKNIKKKQLIDKHYVEALLHNKQDIHIRGSTENEKYFPPTTQATATAATNKHLLMPIKRGYLGPILMEEKTFHVIHHADNGMNTKNQHIAEIESQIRNGHFVELKAKKKVSEPQQNKEKIPTNKNIKSSSTEDILEMQSDQPVSSSQTFFEIKETHKLLKNPNKSVQVRQNPEEQAHLKLTEISNNEHGLLTSTRIPAKEIEKQISDTTIKSLANPQILSENSKPENISTTTTKSLHDTLQQTESQTKSGAVLSTTVFQVMDSVATKTPIVQANTLFTSEDNEKPFEDTVRKEQIESKISDIQIEVYDSTIDSIVASTNFKDGQNKDHSVSYAKDQSSLGKTTKPPFATIQQERFTQYVIDRTETSTQEPINYSTIQVAFGKPEPAAIEIHINVSESFGNESEDLEFSYPQTEYNNNNNERIQDESYDDSKVTDNIRLKIPSNSNGNVGKEVRNDEILVVEIINTDNITDSSLKVKSKSNDELFISDVKDLYTTLPPPPPPPPYQTNFDRDSDTIFYISNTEVKVGESLPNTKNANEERKLKLESQFFPANYMASTHPNVNNAEDINPPHHLYEEDILLSSSRNRADSLKIYRNRNEPSPPLDVTYVGESIIEVEQSPDSAITTTYAPNQQHHNAATPQTDVIIQPAILPEISIGVPVIGELPPQIELKEIDFMPNEAQMHRSGIYDDNDSSNNNNLFNNDIDENTINGGNNNKHDVDVVNNNQRVDESSIQYGGDLIDESADGGFDGVEGSYPFGNPAVVGKTSSSYTSAFMTKLRKQQQQQQQHPNHAVDYAHLYVNYGVNNMRKDELSADVKDSGEILLVSSGNTGGGNTNLVNINSNEQNTTTFKEFLSKGSISNSTMPFISANLTQNERMSNATAFSVMEDANELEDKNTEDIINLISLAIGLFIVILPVVVTCSMFWALRYLYKKYHSNLTDNGEYADQTETKRPLNEDGVEKGEFVHEPSTSPTNSNKDAIEKYPDTSNKPSTTDSNVKFSTDNPLLLLETPTFNTNTTTTATTNSTSATSFKTNDTLKLSLALSYPITHEQAQLQPPTSASSPSTLATTITTECVHTVRGDVDSEDGDDDDDVEMPGPNGSVTKMTLENNLLIVETEERNDISRVARETKMDYNKDGVFVVEVARGIDSKTIPESPVADGTEKMLSMFDTKHNNGGLSYKVTNEKNFINNEKVQIHSPPPENVEEGPRSLHQIEEVEEPTNSPHLNENNNDEIVDLAYKANTGLSQSDLSTTSSSDSNKGYSYGNQELYVVEQSGYSISTPSRNVVLKCDVKDVKDDDRNPGNDHYLKHSPDKKEESKYKEDIMEAAKKPEEGGTRTSSGESPAQKQNDNAQDNAIKVIDVGTKQNLMGIEKKNISVVNKEKYTEEEVFGKHSENCNDNSKYNEAVKIPPAGYNNPIPVEIEVHITPAQIESFKADKSLSPVKSTVTDESSVLKATQNVTEPLVLETISTELEDTLAVGTIPLAESLIPTNNASLCLHMEEDVIENSISDEATILAVPDKFSDNVTLERDINSLKENTNILENSSNQCKTESSLVINDISAKVSESAETEEREIKKNTEEILMVEETPLTNLVFVNGAGTKEDSNLHIKEILEYKDKELEKNGHMTVEEERLIFNEQSPLQINGVALVEKTELAEKENKLEAIEEEAHMSDPQNGLTEADVEPLTNGTTTLPDLVRSPQLQNGHAEVEPISNSITDMENGYDSIMSLPEPPPSTEEQLSSDLSDQQLDSLPPPPPPEIFNLKNLPPPLTNGNTDSPQSEESTNFYNTLPPPPPTTLEVTVPAETATATNGKVHASPLTPPASPPAHFTNNLHAGLCSQPIAVDVNGS